MQVGRWRKGLRSPSFVKISCIKIHKDELVVERVVESSREERRRVETHLQSILVNIVQSIHN
jgi:hypothetical protein